MRLVITSDMNSNKSSKRRAARGGTMPDLEISPKSRRIGILHGKVRVSDSFEARLDKRGRFTLPKVIREYMHINPGDRIQLFTILSAYPVLDAFLALLERDMSEHPTKIKPLDATTAKRIKRLIKDVKVGMDEDLGDEALLDDMQGTAPSDLVRLEREEREEQLLHEPRRG
jgi:antitoxin PrlF